MATISLGKHSKIWDVGSPDWERTNNGNGVFLNQTIPYAVSSLNRRGHFNIKSPDVCVRSETLYKGDVALSTKPVMLIWAPLIPAPRWSCSQQSLLSAGVDCTST